MSYVCSNVTLDTHLRILCLRRHLLLTLQSLNLLRSLEIVLGLPLRRILLHAFEPILEGVDDGIELRSRAECGACDQ